jgi:EpsI family protein
VDLSTGTVPVTRVVAASGSHRRYIAWSYWVDDSLTVDPLRAKLLQSKVKLLFGDQRAALIAVSTPETTSQADAERLLQSFLEALSPVADLVRDATLAPSAPAEQD